MYLYDHRVHKLLTYYLRDLPLLIRLEFALKAASCLAGLLLEIAVSYRHDNKTEPVFYLNVTSEREVGRMKEEDIPME